MNKLKENLQLYLKGLQNFDKVFEGFKNELKMKSGELSEEEVDTIASRRLVCASCPFNSNNAKQLPDYKELTGESYETNIYQLHCSLCSCPIQRKTACLSCSCGIEEWNLKNTNKQLPLKWESYKPE